MNFAGSTTDNAVSIVVETTAPVVSSPIVQFTYSSGAKLEGNRSSSAVTISVELSTPSAQLTTVPINFSGTYESGVDAYGSESSVTILPGLTSGDITFVVRGDLDVESDDTVILTLGVPTNASLGSRTVFTHTILDDDYGLKKIANYSNERRLGQVFNTKTADINGDGLDDIILTGWAVEWAENERNSLVPIKILIQQEDGSLVDCTNNFFLENENQIYGAQRIIVEDFDQDGRPDIFLAGFQDQPARNAPSVLFWNDGGSFSRVEFSEWVWGHAACAGDFFNTGRKDILTSGIDGIENSPYTLYKNYGNRRIERYTDPIEGLSISSAGACALIKDESTGQIAVISTNGGGGLSHSGFTMIFDAQSRHQGTMYLPGSEEVDGINLIHDIVNIIPFDLNDDGQLDLILTDNGDWRLVEPVGRFVALVNQGGFNFADETERYFPSQSNNLLFGYHTQIVNINNEDNIFIGNAAARSSTSLWRQEKGVFSGHFSDAFSAATSDFFAYVTPYTTASGDIHLLMQRSEVLGEFEFYTRKLIDNSSGEIDITFRGTAGPDVLDGGGGDNRILLGFDGNDLGRGLSEGDIFIGGHGTDTAQMTGNAADFVIRLASPSQRSVLRDLSPESYSDFSPVFAIQAKASVTGITLVQSELIQFGEAAAVDPMSLVAGGLSLVVNSKVAGALPSISAAIAQATDGAAIYVSAIHQDPSGSAPIIVTRDNLRIVLENAEAPRLVFQLAENSAVRDLSVFGRGSADLIGNSFNNRLVGNDGPNSIDGRGGNDELFGAGGEDQLFGGTSSDWLDGGDGFDRLFGGSGNDTLVSDERAINAGGDRDQTNAGDLLVGGSGDDVLIAGNSAAGSAPVRMMGGSGADAFRLINSNGLGSTATDPAELSPSNFKAFIADLTQADGLDLSAFRTAASGGGALTQLPVGTAALGDYTIPLSGLYAVGLLGLAEGTAMTRPYAPTDQVAVASALTIAMASAADIQAAAARALSLPSTQALADQILPQLYAPFAEFLNQIYVQY